MSFSELSARQLARLDAICLAYERDVRSGVDRSVEEIVVEAGELPAETLREELEAIRTELQQRESGEAVFRPGARLGRYRIESLLGRGGMGRVYRGLDERLERPVAIKVLADDLAQQPERVERFERESRAVAALRHSNIVSLYDVGTHAGRPYAVMEFLEGQTLRQRLEAGPMTVAEIRDIGIQVASALSAAHDGGIIHRDLKPENLLLVPTSIGPTTTGPTSISGSMIGGVSGTVVKLLDFGLSRPLDGAILADDQTATGVVMGTAGYMAPEQARGWKVTPAADIFSLGCLLYECFYGRKAFAGNTVAESLGAVLHESPFVDPERASEAPDLARLLAACLSKEIDQRPSSAAAVAEQLAAIDPARLNDQAEEPARGLMVASPASARAAASITTSAMGAWRGRLRPAGTLDRRRWFEFVGGAAAGGVSIWSLPRWFASPTQPIDSIAVLPFYKLGGTQGQPVGDRELIEEERVAAMLVNELAKHPNLKVRPFRPLTVASRREFPSKQEFRGISEKLGVGGLVLVEVIGSGDRREINLQLVEASEGDVLWGYRFAYGQEPASLLERTDMASVLAEKIGQQVAAIKATGETKDEEAFLCLVRGKARFDPDSEAGMRSAINCFEHASIVDSHFVDAHAGLALTAMALAARTSAEESQRLVAKAREAVAEAMAISTKDSGLSEDPLVNLAHAIILWQADRKFAEADQYFLAALHSLPNYWQAHREYALYKASLGRGDAVELARRAVVLNPMAVSVRLDEARLRWFQGDSEAALLQSASVRRDEPHHQFAKGLAIDVYEQRQEFQRAARLLRLPDAGTIDRDQYFEQRKASLAKIPYGPFGPTMNQAILEARSEQMDEVRLQQIVDEQPPMLTLLLAAHPSLERQRSWAPAKSVLPTSVTGRRDAFWVS